MRLGEIGEEGLIKRWARGLRLSAGVVRGVGDDAAVLCAPEGELLLFTTDMLVEGVHFTPALVPYRDLGYKALAVNVSDIAAMGGTPRWAVVSLGLPPGAAVEDLDAFYAGLSEAAEAFGVSIVGGDTVRSPRDLVVNVALLGGAAPDRVLYRSGARPGDAVFVTGSIGAAAAGLFLLQHPVPECPEEVQAVLVHAHRRPVPRVAAGSALAAGGAVTALADLSDGLATDLARICAASGTGALVRARDLPVSPEARLLARLAGTDPLEWALYGGEDYELVGTARPEDLPRLRATLAAIGVPLAAVGEVRPREAGLYLRDETGRERPLSPGGYQHFPGNEAR
ncbi:MAG: thiamine-phosphate kinase [Thermoanaerobacterales bacterium]|nr:thiamine-phosphate kinase [Bacillota bacterium]MDI6907817.1 thiamine-phosphate kinase [Thermoanaerobacterales bacterium]